MIFKLVPATTMKTFVSVETGVLSLGKVTHWNRHRHGAGRFSPLNDMDQGREHTDAGGHTIQKLSFTHETLRTVLYIEAWGVLSTTQGSPFMEINSNATGSLVFLESDDLERDSKLEPLTFFSCAESVLWEMDGVAGKEKLTVNDDGDDNDVCGLVELPCSSLDFGFEHLKKEEDTGNKSASRLFGSEPRPTRPGRMFGPVTDAAAGGQEGEKGGGKLHVDALPPPILRHVVLRDHHQAADTVVLEGTQIDRSAGEGIQVESLRMSIVRQPTPATPQQFTAGRSTPPLDDSLPEEISGDMRLAFVQHPATRFESDDSDPEPPPPPENEEWESDVLLPSPPQTMPTLTQRRRRMFLVSVQIITHSLSLLIPPVCDDFMQLLNLGTNRESPNEKASEERIVDPTQIPNPSTLSVALDSTQQFTFDMSTAGTRYNVEHDAAFLMLLNEAFHRTSFNLTPNPQRMETMLIIDGPNPLLN
ncbi:hypothetical protein BLNAU_21494 [Blattamonas nauphoetae]|uniref:Uncharacterized protein n=1 Tax=Blattamonas nauphoetae TaxID=2049346 RepID=A0ABQ9WWV8_9EUKA|nr:hypothetical protein BLNAU_21494 [Blattamonas nauphoetae]